MKALTLLFAVLLPLVACVGADDVAVSSRSSEIASATNPIDHGALPWGVAQTATLTSSAGFHAWQLTVSDTVSATFTTSSVAGSSTDTVVVLYRQQADGSWGASIASNNDGPNPPFSQLSRSLTAGTYRVMVKRRSKSVTGAFALTASCSGTGCGVCDPEPLELVSEDASALDPSIATFNATSRNGYDWCSLSEQALYSTPACPEEPVDLQAIVEQVIAANQDLRGYSFADGTVQTATQIAQSIPFGTYCSPNGPGVAQAVAANVSGAAPQGWLVTNEVPCHNCHEFYHYLVLWYPDGQVLVLPYITGYDS